MGPRHVGGILQSAGAPKRLRSNETPGAIVPITMPLSIAQVLSRTSRRAFSRQAARQGCIAGALVLPTLWSLSGCSTDPGGAGALTGGAATDGTGTGGVVGSGGALTGGSSTGGVGTGGSDATGGSPSTGGAGVGGTTASGGAASGGSGGSASGGAGTGGGSGDPLSPGCTAEFQSPPPDGEQQTLQIQGDSRYYLLDVPDGADNTEPLMLIFALHGFDMNNIAVVDLFNFTERSGGQAITVWPQGEGPHPGDVSHWGDGVLESTWAGNEKNYEFLQQIRSDLGERYCIDQERIFITGFSMGGYFTNTIACEHPDWFRGFAPVAGGGPQCNNADAKVAIMVQHGTADDIVDDSNGEASRDFWLTQNGCGQTSTTSLNNCAFYEGCPDETPVAWCTGNYEHYIPSEVAENAWSFFSSL
jgi:polyhydroxybutyrate depolymerase